MTNNQVPSASFDTPSLVERAKSVGLWGVGLSFLTTVLPPMTVLSATLGSDRIDGLNRWYCRTQVRLTGSKWRAVVDPAVDPEQTYMFAQNHTNHFDHTLIYESTPHFKQGVELESHFKIPFYGWFMKSRGTIPVRPGKQGQSPEVMAHIQRELDKRHSILAFPEGHRTLDGRIGPFRKGVFFIARDLGLPIVPTTVTGAFEMMRKGSLMIRAGHEITVYCDAPVATKGIPDSSIPELVEHVRSVMKKRMDGYWMERGWRGELDSPEQADSRQSEDQP